MKCVSLLGMAVLCLSTACTPVLPKASVADRDPLRRAVVEDVVKVMSDVFEPTETMLVPSRAMVGSFGTALIAALRARGFTVGAGAGRGQAFDCNVQSVEGRMYMVTASVGGTAFSRLWVLDGATAYSGGAWTARE